METLVDDKKNGNKLRYLCRVSDISQGKSKTFTITYDNATKKIEIAIFKIEGKFYAISERQRQIIGHRMCFLSKHG